MKNFINKAIDKNGVEAEIRDARIVTPEEATGKFLKDDFTWAEAGGESETLIDLTSNQNATANDFLEAIGFNPSVHASQNDALILKNVRLKYYYASGHHNDEILFEKIKAYS